MNTPEVIATEVCVTVLALGGGALAVGWRALRDGWVKASVSFGTVAPLTRWRVPARARKAPTDTAGEAADSAPASPAAQPFNPGGPVRAA